MKVNTKLDTWWQLVRQWQKLFFTERKTNKNSWNYKTSFSYQQDIIIHKAKENPHLVNICWHSSNAMSYSTVLHKSCSCSHYYSNWEVLKIRSALLNSALKRSNKKKKKCRYWWIMSHTYEKINTVSLSIKSPIFPKT
jgi:hypothetical protein